MDEKDSNIHNNKELETELREYEQADEKLAEKRASNDGNNNLEETITSTYKKLMIKTKLYDISMLLSSSRLFLQLLWKNLNLQILYAISMFNFGTLSMITATT